MKEQQHQAPLADGHALTKPPLLSCDDGSVPIFDLDAPDKEMLNRLKIHAINIRFESTPARGSATDAQDLPRRSFHFANFWHGLLHIQSLAKAPRQQRLLTTRLFSGLELFSQILPIRIRRDAYEPSYHDAKGDYLAKRKKYRGTATRLWLALCFILHSLLMMLQAAWEAFSGKSRTALAALAGAVAGWFRAN